MGIPVLIMGESGSGKSTSMRNFDADEVGVFNVASKPLPFRKKLKKVDKAGYGTIAMALRNPKLKRYVIDDSQYLLSFEMFERVKETGYNKFTDMALHFYNLIQQIILGTPDDVIVYFLHHVESCSDGKLKAKTVGKMLDEKLTVEGLFSIVLMCETDGASHYFVTQSDGRTTAKSPMEMFDLKIDNDLKLVDSEIRKYYEIGGNENE
ncbi:MAG: ATP-binding protein [Ruminococcus sp.]|nr:ATP-binding protein [Ruminococcus sp.]